MIIQFLKYNMVGIVNTFVGFSIVFGLMFIGFSPELSNLVGYGIGMVVSFYLNRRYTFNQTQKKEGEMLKFLMVLFLSYGINFITLKGLLIWTNPYIAQLSAAVVYTLSSFFLLKFFVFKEH